MAIAVTEENSHLLPVEATDLIARYMRDTHERPLSTENLFVLHQEAARRAAVAGEQWVQLIIAGADATAAWELVIRDASEAPFEPLDPA